MKRTPPPKPFWEMTADELARATREFEKTIPASRRKPMNKAQRERFQRALRNGGQLHQHALLGIDVRLLSAAVAYAKRKGIPLSAVLERGLRRELAVQE
jgi:hypothetical protein